MSACCLRPWFHGPGAREGERRVVIRKGGWEARKGKREGRKKGRRGGRREGRREQKFARFNA